MIISRLHKISHSLHARLTLWVMLTVVAVFTIVTLVITNVTRKAFLNSSEENAKSRIEIANQRINSFRDIARRGLISLTCYMTWCGRYWNVTLAS